MSGRERLPIVMPGLSEMEAGVIVEWRRASGDRVARGEIVAVVDADKVTLDVESPDSGILEIEAAEDAEVAVGQPIGWVRAE